MGSSLLFPATSVTGVCWSRVQVKVPRFCVRASLDTNVSDMSVNAPKCLFPPEPEHYRGPKLKVAIIGAGLAGMSTAGELLDQGHETYDKARNALALALSPVVRALVDPDGALKDVGDLDSISFSDWFLSKGGTRTSIQRMWDPVAYALLRMLKGSPDATDKKVVQAEAYVTACDVPGIKRLLPSSWREMKFFNNIYELVGVPVVTVQLRYNGWVTELQDLERSRCVLTPGDTYMPLPNDEIIRRVAKQVLALFPLSQGLEVIWSFVVKIGQFLYHEGPGKDPFRPDQKTQVKNLFLAGSYTKQDYIDIMEGASLSGRQASAYICNAREELVALRKQLAAFESQEQMEVPTTTNDDLSLV
ncbi:Zeta-carotene desaturase /chromoplastic [Citrus sinensis]|nr:Zeta-carotene desaturase /chromoplastic [Citrus sinensis]